MWFNDTFLSVKSAMIDYTILSFYYVIIYHSLFSCVYSLIIIFILVEETVGKGNDCSENNKTIVEKEIIMEKSSTRKRQCKKNC